MSLRKRIGLGVLLYCDAAGGVAATLVGSVVDTLDGPHVKAEITPVPLLSDTYLEKVKGQIDGGEVTFTIAYDLDHDVTALLKTMRNDVTTCPTWKITYPNGTLSDDFAAWLSQMSPTRKLGGYITAAITLAVNGNPG